MNCIKHTPLAAAILLALNSPFYSSLSFAAPGDAVGNEFQVNTYTTDDQRDAMVAMDATGDYVVTWDSYGEDGSFQGIYAQRYHADGTTADNEFQVNTYTTSDQRNVRVAMDATGDFVIVWQSSGQDGDGGGIYAQRYYSDGTTAGGEFQVNTYTTSEQQHPSVAMDSTGGFVVAWDGRGQAGDPDGVYARRYNANGTAASNEFLVNTWTTNAQKAPDIAMDATGDFVVVWDSYGQDGDMDGIYAQRYNADGTTAGNEFQVNTYTTSYQALPSVAMDSTGNFVITWTSIYQTGDDSYGVYAQRYSANGNPAGSEFHVNTYTTSTQGLSRVAMDKVGDFVITWLSNQDGDGSGIYAQRYNADGTSANSEFQVNTYTSFDQREPAIAMDDAGDFVIAWQSDNQDGSNTGVYAQDYGSVAPITTTTTTSSSGGGSLGVFSLLFAIPLWLRRRWLR